MCLATLEQLETHSLTTMVNSLPPRTGTMIEVAATVLSHGVVLGGILVAILQTSMVSILTAHNQVAALDQVWYGAHGKAVSPSILRK